MKATPPRPPRPRRARIHDAAGPVPRADAQEAAEPVSIVSRSAAFMEPIDPQHRVSMISEAAFYLAERRSFDPGHEMDDWLTAERAIDLLLRTGEGTLESVG